jgi:flagellar basal-body rod modification protein FlgD
MITAVKNYPTDSSTAQTPASAKKGLGKDDFMKLLITQLTTQDPLKPMDSQDFGAQLAQFSSLEQMTNVNENLKQLQNMQATQASSATVNLIGKKVNAEGNAVQLKSGTMQNLGYSLGKDAEKVAVTIYDPKGFQVNTLSAGTQTAGVNSIQWNGKDENGNALPEGTYTFKVGAEDAKGSPVATTTYTNGLVTEVIFEGGVNKAVINGNKIPVSQISSVTQN